MVGPSRVAMENQHIFFQSSFTKALRKKGFADEFDGKKQKTKKKRSLVVCWIFWGGRWYFSYLENHRDFGTPFFLHGMPEGKNRWFFSGARQVDGESTVRPSFTPQMVVVIFVRELGPQKICLGNRVGW